jgi:hypothetical protein
VSPKRPTARAAGLLAHLAPGTVVLALAAPWVLGFSTSHAAVANAVAFGMAFGPLALLSSALRPAAAACVAGGAWLAASPWALGYASAGPRAWGAAVLLGFALAATAWPGGPRAARAAEAPAELGSAPDPTPAPPSLAARPDHAATRRSRAA